MMRPLIRKYRNYPGLRNFFTLLGYCGISSFIVGVLTGTWAADLPKYFGDEGNLLQRAVNSLTVLDMLDKPLVALGLALGMGVLNQFWGIWMKMYGHLRRGDRWSAVCDGGFWFFLLPGLVLLLAWYFSSDKPAWMLNAGTGLALVGAVGLVLTQGRNEETLVGRVVVGVVSLYGIVGTYGAVTFIGDTLSYSRLLALGLTTAIVGMAVNIIGGMVGAVPVIGIILFVVVAAGGHVFNLLISGLGAFIHSARLIFVEFFGRFYDPGAERFAPLGAVAGRIRVMD
jgi:V/A-type H+-transporting ATPase subunit I